MPSKPNVLTLLIPDDLLFAGDAFELTVGDGRVRDRLVDAVAIAA
jgi:hypothetical protein